MSRVSLATLVTVTLALLAACGDDTVEPADGVSVSTLPPTDAPTTERPGTDPPTTERPGTDPPTTEPSESPDPGATGYEHPTGADEVVLSYSEVGGFTTAEFAFQTPPIVLVSGDGQVITAGAMIEIFPGPLLPPLQVQPITEDGIQALLVSADEAGLLREVDYADDADQFVADAPTALVEIDADGESWMHSAYALGIEPPPGGAMELSPDRAALLAFVQSLYDLPALVGAENVGDAVPFVPDAYEIVAVAVDDPSTFARDGIEPTIVDWPADSSVRLADATECTRVGADEVGDLLEQANQLTLFVEDDLTYQLLARQVVPGRDCADA